MLRKISSLLSVQRKSKRNIQRPVLFKQSSWDDSLAIAKYDPLYLFKSNVVVYRCVSLIAKSVASIDWFLKDQNQKIQSHELDYLLQSPNPLQCKVAFLENLVTNLLLFGKAYVYQTGSKFHNLQVLKSEHVYIEQGENGVPKAYVYENGNNKLVVDIDPVTGQSDILHIQLTNADLTYDGTSPCTVISKVVEFYNQVTEHNIALLKKGGRPSGALVVKSENLNPEKFLELEQQIRKWNTGSKNAGEVLVLSSECEWKEMGLRPLDTNFLEGQHAGARQIAQVFGVPPMLIGIQGDSTFANYKEARVHFWEDTILPMMGKICSSLNLWFFDRFKVKICADIDSIEALEPKRNSRLHHIDQVKFLTINEKRAHFGYPALDENSKCDAEHINEAQSAKKEGKDEHDL